MSDSCSVVGERTAVRAKIWSMTTELIRCRCWTRRRWRGSYHDDRATNRSDISITTAHVVHQHPVCSSLEGMTVVRLWEISTSSTSTLTSRVTEPLISVLSYLKYNLFSSLLLIWSLRVSSRRPLTSCTSLCPGARHCPPLPCPAHCASS